MKKEDEIKFDHNGDGIDRRGFLKCMAWAGTGTLCVMSGGVMKSFSLSRLGELDPAAAKGEFSFVQISDSHMGFNKPANPDVIGTLKAAIEKINALPGNPEFLLQPGELLQVAHGRLEVIAYENLTVEAPRPAVVQRMCALLGGTAGRA